MEKMDKKNYQPTLSVVLPLYKCADSINELYSRIVCCLEQFTKDFEIVFVNDASPDQDWEIIKELVNCDQRVVGINLSRNFGQHSAITAGLHYSRGQWVVVMDGDLQDRPEEISKLYNQALMGFDIVLGRREMRQDSLFKRLGSRLFYWVFSYMTGVKQDGTIANFGIYNRKVINTLLKMREKLKFFPTMVQWVGYKSIAIPIEHDDRKFGKSSYSLKKLVSLALNVIVAFSDKPLRLTIQLGLCISSFSFIYAVFICIRAMLGIRSIEGWSSLIVSIWFLSGLIIFTLGILGIYVSKIFDEVKDRPIYIVGDVYAQETRSFSNESERLLRFN